MHKRFSHIFLSGALLLLFSCKNMPSENHGPIVLGDSSTIVTENDPSRLQDLVTDLKPTITSSEPKDTAEKPAQPQPDTNRKTATASILKPPIPIPAPAPQLSGNGLKADFGSLAVLIPNVSGKQSGRSNLAHANGAVYTLQNGSLNGNIIKATANVTKISQRYQTIVVVKNELGMLPLESLSVTTEWTPLKGDSRGYKIAGLEERSLKFADADRGDIREAVQKATRRHHINRRKQQEWEHSVRNVRAANQTPLYVVLRSVMWKIEGKDASGKPVVKQIRVDMPM